MDIDIKQAGGDASEATLAEIRDLLEKQKDFNESIWIDATDTYCIRRIVFDEDLQTYTVSFTLPDGASYSPTLPIEPASSGADREIVTQTYLAIGSGTGYSAGDIVTLSTIYDTNTATVLASIWWNTSTDTVISPAPALGNLEPEGITQNIAAAVGTVSDAAYTSGSGTLVSILKGIFGKFGTLGQKNMAGSAPVVIASDQSSIPVTPIDGLVVSGSVTSATSVIASTDTTGYNSVAVQVTSAGATCTITYEASNDNTTFYSVAGYTPLNLGDTVSVTTSTAAILLVFPCVARYFRARVSTYGSGTVAATAVFRKEVVPVKQLYVGANGSGTSTGALRIVTSTNDTMIGALTETAPASDTASSGLNGRLQRIAQNLTGTTSAPATAIGSLTINRLGISDGTSWVRLRGDSNGRVEPSPNPIAPTATQTASQFTVNAAVSSGVNSASTVTTPAAGGRWVSITNNSGIVVDLTTGGTSGGADGTTIITAIPGDSFTMPFAIAASVVLRIKPTSGALTTADYVQVRVS